MIEFAVTYVAEGNAVAPTWLGGQLAGLLNALKPFAPIGRFANDGTRYSATLIIEANDEAEARRIGQSAVSMAAAKYMPNWPVEVTTSFQLAAA